jgi:molecular chaperone GrpE
MTEPESKGAEPKSHKAAHGPAHARATKGAAAAASAQREQATAADLAAVKDELTRVKAERDEYLDHLKRLGAEFENYRKRVQRDSEQLRKLAAEDVVASLLPVVDNMYRACAAAEQHDEGKVVEGVEKVTGQLMALLRAQGLEELPAQPGDAFDPLVHEAVIAQPSTDHQEGHIVSVLERGYALHGKLLRAARVIVASGPPAESTEPSEKPSSQPAE